MTRDVAVIIAAWNAEPWVARAVRSALAQPEAAEVWVVDDASTDATADQARSADDGTGRLRVVSLTTNSGPAVARNVALGRTSQPWIAILDADDQFLDGRLASLRARADDCDFIADDVLMIGEARLAHDLPNAPMQAVSLSVDLSAETFILGNIAQGGCQRSELGFLKPLIRADYLRQTGLRYDERLRLGEDYAFYARALLLGARFRIVDAVGYVALWREQSISSLHGVEDLLGLIAVDQELAAQSQRPEDLAALRRHLRHTVSRAIHHELIEIRRRKGTAAGLWFLAQHGREAPALVARILSHRLGLSGGRRVDVSRQMSRLLGRRFEAWPPSRAVPQGLPTRA